MKNPVDEQLPPKVAQKVLDVFLLADLMHQIHGTPHCEFLSRQADRHLGQAKRVIRQVAALGPEAKTWMDIFIEEMQTEIEYGNNSYSVNRLSKNTATRD